MGKAMNPFPGLRPFLAKESELFFGRDEQIGEALDRLLDRRLLAVVGVSGCGKSSLVQAGMLPALEMGLAGDPAQRWRVATMRPGDGPLRELRRCLGFGEGALAERSYGLLEAAETHLAEGEKLLLVVDQFEEIFPFRDRKVKDGAGSEADLFVSYLLRAAQDPARRVYVLLTMRSDYLGECAKFHGLPEALNDGQYLVPRMTRQQLQEAIEGPLQAADVKMHPALLQELLNQCDEEPDNLPLLQHLLWRLFEEWPGAGPITREMAAAVGGLGGALDQEASRVLASLDGEQKRVAEVVFRRITESRRQADGEEEDRPVRRPQTLASLAVLAGVSDSVLRAVVAHFVERGLLVVRSTDAGDKVDLPHECLCLRWGTLRDWIDAEAQDAKSLRFLADSVGKSHLTGLGLEQALAWVKSGRFNGAWATRYLTGNGASDTAEWVVDSYQVVVEGKKQELRRAKAERRALTAELAKYRRDRQVAAVLSLLLIGFAGLGAWAWMQKSAAVALGSEALARQMASKSMLVSGEDATDIERAALLAARSVTIHPTFDGDRSLRAQLGRLPQASLSHRGPVNALAFSVDGRWVATGSEDMTARVMEAASGNEVARLVHEASVNAVAWSPDGKWVATGSDDKTARVMEAATGKEVARLANQGPVSTVSFNLDGRWVATGSQDGTARVIDATTGQELVRVVHRNALKTVAFSPDGILLATASLDGTARLIVASTGKEIGRVTHQEGVKALVFSPDGRVVATGGNDRTARITEVATGRELARILHEEDVNALAFSPNGAWVATGTYSGMVRVVEVTTGKEVTRIVCRGSVHALRFGPDARTPSGHQRWNSASAGSEQ